MSKFDEYNDEQLVRRVKSISEHINFHLREAGELGIRLAAGLSQPHQLPRGRRIGELIEDITEQVDDLMVRVVNMEHYYEELRKEAVRRKVRTPLRKRDLDVHHQYSQYDKKRKVWS